MYTLGNRESSAREMHVCGRSRSIKEIDLGAVFFTREDRETLALITSFDLSHNCIEHLQHLDALTSLTRLNVSNNRVTNVGSLPVTITHLDLSQNQLTSLDGIGQLPHLRELNVGYNRLNNLTGLAHSQPLQVLRVEGNRIVSSIGLEGMSQLRLLILDHNLIDNANELLFLSSTPSLEILSLRENPVSNVNGYRALVAHLQPAVVSLDGVPLLHDDGPPPEASARALLTAENATLKVALSSPPVTAADVCTTSLATRPSSNIAHNSQAKDGVRRTSELPISSKDGRTVTNVTTDVATANEDASSGTIVSVGRSSHRAPQQNPKKLQRQSTQQLRTAVSLTAALSQKPGRAEETTGKPSDAEIGVVAASLPLKDAKRELHEVQLLLQEVKKENEYLRTRNRTLVAQLKESRRLVSSQLDEINELRVKLSAVEEREAASRQRLDRMKRNARVVDKYAHDTVDAMAVERERLRAVYESQIADLHQQLKRARQHSLQAAASWSVGETQQHEEGDEKPRQLRPSPKGIQVDDLCVEIEEVVMEETPETASRDGGKKRPMLPSRDTERSPTGSTDARAADVGRLAGELKSWLYSKMAEDARQAGEEHLLNHLRHSLERESAMTAEQQCEHELTADAVLGTLPIGVPNIAPGGGSGGRSSSNNKNNIIITTDDTSSVSMDRAAATRGVADRLTDVF